MLREGSRVDHGEDAGPAMSSAGKDSGWREADQRLRGIAGRRAALDAEEAHWLREAERLQIWKPLGMVSMVDYLERVMGHAPRTAQQRLRVARRLATLPELTTALAEGELSFSAVRELLRTVTPETERAWLDEARGKSLREIEELVSGHAPGDLPADPPDPTIESRVVTFELSPSTFALLRQARLSLDEDHGRHLDDDPLIAALCTAVLERGGTPATEPTGRAKFQIALTVCERCDQGWQEGAGAQVPVDAATVERARCEAQHLGSLDGDHPDRAHQDIPPSVIRFVWRRDGGRCQTPGCRSARGLEIHHIVRRADGGTHDPSNLTLRCSACHGAHHAGLITISGTAPDHLELRRQTDHAAPVGVAGRGAHVGVSDLAGSRLGAAGPASRLDAAMTRTQARDALVGLGWQTTIARAAVDEAIAHVGTAPIDIVLREALRRCPKPRC